MGGTTNTPFDECWRAEDRGYTTPCWIWIRALGTGGYAMLRRDGFNFAHVYAWVRENGPIPDGLDLDHLCRVRACVNPDHLEPVTRAVNCRRSPRTKLTMEKAREIRALAASGLSRSKIAARYGVTKGMINHIVHNRAWREGEERAHHASLPPSIG